MSSHHFVKEGQEPALFIIDPLSFELAQPLLEWAPLVMVLAAAVDEVLTWGIKIDLVLVPAGSEENMAEKLMDQFPVQFCVYSPNSEIVAAGLNALKSAGATAVNVMMNVSDIPVDIGLDQQQISIINQTMRWSYVSKAVFEKWVSKGTCIAISITPEADLTFKGLAADGDYYVALHDAVISIRASSPFWIGQKH